MNRKTALALAAAGLLSLAGCGTSKPFHTTLDGMTNETGYASDRYFDFSTFVSLSGLVPEQVVAGLSYQPHFSFRHNSPVYSIGFTPGYSLIADRRYPMQDCAAPGQKGDAPTQTPCSAVVTGIREALDKAQDWSAQLAEAKVKSELVNTLAAKFAASPAPGEEATILRAASGTPDLVDTSGKVDAAKLASFNNANKELQKTLSGNITTALNNAKTAARSGNVVIANWAREKSSNFNLVAAAVFNGSTNAQTSQSGILILGDLRLTTLFAGQDFMEFARQPATTYAGLANQGYVTTFQIAARHLAYSADLDVTNAISVSLGLTKDQLKNFSKLFAQLDAQMAAGIGNTLSATNAASLSNSTVTTRPHCFWPASQAQASLSQEITGGSGFGSVFIVKARLNEQLRQDLSHLQTRDAMTAEQVISKPCAVAAN